MPPPDPVERRVHVSHDEDKIWRKPWEKLNPELVGAPDKYSHQVPLSRAIPLWGGISAAGFTPILWHEKKKVKTDETGKVADAIRRPKPVAKRGSWRILCDNERFLHTRNQVPNSRREQQPPASSTEWPPAVHGLLLRPRRLLLFGARLLQGDRIPKTRYSSTKVPPKCTTATNFRTPAECNSRPQVPLTGHQPRAAFFSVLVGFLFWGAASSWGPHPKNAL